MRSFAIATILAITLLGNLPASRAAAGGFFPLLACAPAAGDSMQTALTFAIYTHDIGVMCTVEFIPFAQYNLPALPVLGVDCPAGFTSEPDSIPGAILIRGCIQPPNGYPIFTIRIHGKIEPYVANFYNSGGGLAAIKEDIEWCPGTSSPALPASWGRVKGLYR